jgi:hypothetical protein
MEIVVLGVVAETDEVISKPLFRTIREPSHAA